MATDEAGSPATSASASRRQCVTLPIRGADGPAGDDAFGPAARPARAR